MEKIPVIVVAGPTASGKTALSIALAKRLCGEIVSADSMQIYKFMNIGTAKPSVEEQAGVRHHLLDFLDPGTPFSVAEFVSLAHEKIAEICANGGIPIVAGGTGLYIDSLIQDVDFIEEEDTSDLRQMLSYVAEVEGPEALLELLNRFDPVSAERLHPNNLRRIIRAVEFYLKNKSPISAHQEETKKKESRYEPVFFGVLWDRKTLYERIDKRVDLMVEAGLFEEVQKLMEMGYGKVLQSMQGIGYKQVVNYFRGFATKDETIAIIKRDSRRYAKRQMTWFRREERMHWLDATGDPVAEAMEILRQEGFIKEEENGKTQ